MIKNYFLVIFRGMMKNKLFVIINIFGMGIATACCIVAFLGLEYDLSFNSSHTNKESIYRVGVVREFEGATTRLGYASMPLGEVIHKTIPDVDRSSRYVRSWSDLKRGDDLFSVNVNYVDPGFFDMFTWRFLSGSATELKSKGSIFISEQIAVRLFGSASAALGKPVSQVLGEEKKELVIAGVFAEPPANSSFYRQEGSAYLNFENYVDEKGEVYVTGWKNECSLFVQINELSRVVLVHDQLQKFVSNYNEVRPDFQIKEFVLDQFVTMAHRDRAEEVRTETWDAPPLSAIISTAIMSMLLLLIACFNLTNTAMAISSRRLKEIGIRKVMGTMRIQLIAQFIGETTLVCLLSLLVGLGFTDLLIEGWNIVTGNNIHLESDYLSKPEILMFLIGLLIFAGLVAGSYPAFYISKFQPVTILKGKLQFGGTNNLTRVLLGLQFAFSLIAIINAIGFYQNAKFQEQYDLGFDIRGSVTAWLNDPREFDTYRNALQSNPEVLSIAGAKTGIMSSPERELVKHEAMQAEVDIIYVGENYLNTMDLKLIEGRDFLKDSKTDRSESVIITQNMARIFGWESAVGKEILWKDTVKLHVVGVIKDVYTQGLWKEMEPMMIRYVLPENYSQIVVSASAEHVAAVNAYMEQQWKTTFPDRLYNGRMLVTELRRIIDLNHSIVMSYAFLGFIAMLLSATGLFTLLSLNIIKRMKEIGVRKILGASVGNITRIVNAEFIIILAAACVLGSWSAYSMSNLIMGSIWKYYQGVNALTFVSAISILFVISFLAIGYKVISVARMNPAKTLRDE